MKQDQHKSPSELIEELEKLHLKVHELETAWVRSKDRVDELYRQRDQLDTLLAQRDLELQTARDLLQLVKDTIPVPVFCQDPEGRFMGCNRAYEAAVGLGREKIIGRMVHDLFPKEVAEIYEFNDQDMVGNKNPQIYEGKMPYADGSQHEVVFYKAPFLRVDGEVVGLVGVFHDITRYKQVEEALRHSGQRYKRITEAVTDYVYTVRVEGGRPVDTVHGAACVAVTGYTSEEFHADPYLWINMVDPCDRKAVVRQAADLLAGKDVAGLEHRIIRKDGTKRWVSSDLVPNRDHDHKLISYDGLVRDITKRKQAEEEREKLIGELQEALAHIKTLRGIVPICAHCKKIRDDKGYWEQVEVYVRDHSDAEFSHGICPECLEKHYPNIKPK